MPQSAIPRIKPGLVTCIVLGPGAGSCSTEIVNQNIDTVFSALIQQCLAAFEGGDIAPDGDTVTEFRNGCFRLFLRESMDQDPSTLLQQRGRNDLPCTSMTSCHQGRSVL